LVNYKRCVRNECRLIAVVRIVLEVFHRLAFTTLLSTLFSALLALAATAALLAALLALLLITTASAAFLATAILAGARAVALIFGTGLQLPAVANDEHALALVGRLAHFQRGLGGGAGRAAGRGRGR